MNNREHCKSIADTLEAICDGALHICPECGELIRTYNEQTDDDGYAVYACECGCTVDAEPEPETMLNYFSDAYDVEYRIGSDRKYRSVRLMIACGGPNIFVDTAAKEVQLHWWTEHASYPVSREACDAIDEDFEMLFTC